MPLIDDFSEDDEEGTGFGGGRPLGSGAPGQSGGEPSKQIEPEFVPWERFVSANADVSKREAGKLAGGVEAQAKGVQSELGAAGQKHEQAIGANYATPQKRAAPSFGSLQSGVEQPAAFGNGAAASRAFGATQPVAPPPSAKAQKASQQAADRAAPVDMGERPIAGRGVVDSNKLTTDVSSGAPVTTGAGLAGSKDLESQFNAAKKGGWDDFLGRALKANEAANNLGTESGVEALLQKQGASPNSAFDAALIGGAGGERFSDLAKQYGGGVLGKDIEAASKEARSQWDALMGDVDSASAARDAEIQGATDEMNRIAEQQQRYGDAEANRKELEDARTNFANGIAAYSVVSRSPGGQAGSVNGLGTAKQFLDALKSGAQFGDGINWENTPGVQEQMDAASKALGISQEQLAGYFERMSATEWTDFWLLGVVPSWMEGVTAFGYGKPGGWKAPYLEQVASYGDDGGMWNAITNMWKDSALLMAESAASGPGGAVEGGAKAATYKGPGGGK